MNPLHLVQNRLYVDPAAFERERERIFERVWSFYCHDSEVRQPGQFFARDVAGSPLLVVRNARGELRAFYNTCRHRGALVTMEERGRAASLRCPYHSWTYSLDGALLSVPGPEAYEGSGWCQENNGLVPVRVEEAHGLVFVCLDPEAPPLADFLGEDTLALLGQALGGAPMEVFHRRTLDVKANWKIWPENARDGYHVPCLHPFLMKASPPLDYRLLPNGHAVQRLGMNLDMVDAEIAPKLLLCPLPGVEPGEGWVLVLFPDVTIMLRSNMVVVDSQIPLGAEQTLMESRVLGLCGDGETERVLRKLNWETWFNNPVEYEDYPIFEAQQRGLHGKGVRSSFIGRGAEAHTGLRGDDNRLRHFWAAWRQYMGAERNAL